MSPEIQHCGIMIWFTCISYISFIYTRSIMWPLGLHQYVLMFKMAWSCTSTGTFVRSFLSTCLDMPMENGCADETAMVTGFMFRGAPGLNVS